jgi:hypothetical protein
LLKLIQIILEIIGWLTIVAGTTFLAAIVAFILYKILPPENIKTICLILLSTGFIAGCVWATFIWKKYGTVEWLSGIRRIS